MSDAPKPPKVPCGSCPYRKDVPSGIWAREEYEKLPAYDGETWEQPSALFMCHQKDGCLCGGWLLTHDRRHLLALRMHGARLDPTVWDYSPPVRVFATGAAAAAHGLSGLSAPNSDAVRVMARIERKRIAK